MKRSYEQEMMDSPNHPQDLLEEDLKNLRLFQSFPRRLPLRRIGDRRGRLPAKAQKFFAS